jgi:hypothetical protein
MENTNDEFKDQRFPIGDALSEFFLDTELDKEDYVRISKILPDSKYTIMQLKEILYYQTEHRSAVDSIPLRLRSGR